LNILLTLFLRSGEDHEARSNHYDSFREFVTQQPETEYLVNQREVLTKSRRFWGGGVRRCFCPSRLRVRRAQFICNLTENGRL